MVVLNKGQINEAVLRIVLESEVYGSEYFNDYECISEIIAGSKRLLNNAINEVAKDGVARRVSIVIVPKAQLRL